MQLSCAHIWFVGHAADNMSLGSAPSITSTTAVYIGAVCSMCMLSMGDVLFGFAVVSAMMVQSIVSGTMCVDGANTSSASVIIYHPNGSLTDPKYDKMDHYCDKCYPPSYPINTDNNWNSTITGYYCDDLSEGSSLNELDVTWVFWSQANSQGTSTYYCSTGGSLGRQCSCTVSCLEGDCSYTTYGKCRCAMHGDATQHYCFNAIKACPICPIAGIPQCVPAHLYHRSI
jgi:hypothetical protein